MIFRKFVQKDNKDLHLIFGLGNPGREYEYTRHNIGFLVIDQLARKWKVEIRKSKFHSIYGDYRLEHSESVVKLIKPMTYMNNSGEAVRSFVNFYKQSLDNVLVVFDDLDLPFGTLRFRQYGGSSGQKGMESIINHLGSEKFPRLRIGIGRPPGKMDVAKYILNSFKSSEIEQLEILLMIASDAIDYFVRHGIEKSMTKFNHQT